MLHPNPRSLAAIYTTVTCILSWSYLAAMKVGIQLPAWAFAFVLMWIPGLVALALRFIFKQGMADAGFHPGAFRYWMIACITPLALATAVYGLAWILNQVHITPYLKQQSMYGPLPLRLTWLNAEAGTTGLLLQRFAVAITWGLAFGFASGLGEEIGWRGFLLPKLVEARVRRPILISGMRWAVWHVPFVLLTF